MTTAVLVHVIISLVAIAAGVVVMAGLLTAKRLDRWTAVFLATTLATTVTGFLLPADRFLPSHAVGILSLVGLAVAYLARYTFRMVGKWRTIYVLSAVLSLYLNVFVLVVQAFLKVPALQALAPTQSEPPFQLAQLAVLVLFVGIAIAGVRRFRLDPFGPDDPTTAAAPA